MKAILYFLLSIKTALGLFCALIALAFIGSIMLPENLTFFSGIDDIPLFQWLSANSDLRLTWWIYLMILILAVMSVNAIFCTVEGLMKKLSGRNIVVKLSPHIIHIGVLLVLFGHLLTASVGFKTDILIKAGEKKSVGGNTSLSLVDVKVEKDENGYDTDWEATLLWFEAGEKRYEKILRPVHPLYFGRFGIYFKSVSTEPEPSALVRITSDPGALFALIGGVLLSIGGIGFIYGRLYQ